MAEVLRSLVRCIDAYPQIVKNTRITLPPRPQRRPVAGSYRKRESATLVVAKVSKQKLRSS